MEQIKKNIYFNIYTITFAFLTLGWIARLIQILMGYQTLGDNPEFIALIFVISGFFYPFKMQRKFLKTLKSNPKDLFTEFPKSVKEALGTEVEAQLLYNENGQRVYFIDYNHFLKQNELVSIKEFKNGDESIWVVQQRLKTLF